MGERVEKLNFKERVLYDLTGYLQDNKRKELMRRICEKMDILTILSGSKTRPIEVRQDTLSIDDLPENRQFQSKINECSDEGFSEYDKSKRRMINDAHISLQSWGLSDLEKQTDKTLVLSGNLTEHARNITQPQSFLLSKSMPRRNCFACSQNTALPQRSQSPQKPPKVKDQKKRYTSPLVNPRAASPVELKS